ncbi:hypothetical protein MOMA_07241 [Moraxella macacae 0408225]|uniref:DUF8198 domain-containing protein n=1 Tax=Moraxella macacae 0408225 TaxID=1230338 RepID=L2F7A1_9GAMM|nr:hypothetical protein [Moraxella macacae]ELA08338.1 hypothetical protein MOMA_07241 [Moraxella macacae 0408225]
MSILADLQQNLTQFWQLDYHQHANLNQTLQAVQTWQRQRLFTTHQALFTKPENQLMANFLIEQLYGGDKFDLLAKQLERMAKKGEKVEKFIPQKSLETAIMGVKEAIFALELDLQLANYLLQNNLIVNEENIIIAYQAVNAKTEREQQLKNLALTYEFTQKHLKSFLVQKTFDMAKPLAFKHGFDVLYQFVEDGFVAMKPIKNMKDFIDPFCAKEQQIIDNIYAQKTAPFQVSS